ncbi:protein kinase C-binding protein 1-like [Contarinia nasturtii]|uniref:protein kinase C-binding protein 1-like n=1 Tax=Contarinia nasturtii TaxID=265458 RepID=UPI0012D3F201|nr:protein kinase C-binding protein 1-like [Contarinia nasturtii]
MDVAKSDLCWECIQENWENCDLSCIKCKRSYHSSCLPQSAQNDVDTNNWLCPVCVESEAADDKPSDMQWLPLIMDRVTKTDFYQVLKQTHHSIVILDNLRTVMNNIDSYENFAEFRGDILWIRYNCISAYSGFDRDEKGHAAGELLEYIDQEIKCLKNCMECYANEAVYPESWFKMACAEPHLLVSVKSDESNIERPAKLMSIDGQSVNVRLFGDHSHTNVQATNVYLYSESDLNQWSNNAAVTEVREYIENIREKFGSFAMAKAKTFFNPALHESYLYDMVPALAERRAMDSSPSSSSMGRLPDETDNKKMRLAEKNDDKPEDLMKLDESKLQTVKDVAHLLAKKFDDATEKVTSNLRTCVSLENSKANLSLEIVKIDHLIEIATLKKNHENKIEALKNDHVEEIEMFKNTAENANEVINDLLQQMEDLKKQHLDAKQKLRENFQGYLNRMRDLEYGCEFPVNYEDVYDETDED